MTHPTQFSPIRDIEVVKLFLYLVALVATASRVSERKFACPSYIMAALPIEIGSSTSNTAFLTIIWLFITFSGGWKLRGSQLKLPIESIV
jgi:hypothetical protein